MDISSNCNDTHETCTKPGAEYIVECVNNVVTNIKFTFVQDTVHKCDGTLKVWFDATHMRIFIVHCEELPSNISREIKSQLVEISRGTHASHRDAPSEVHPLRIIRNYRFLCDAIRSNFGKQRRQSTRKRNAESI